jgi:hypothetical protein
VRLLSCGTLTQIQGPSFALDGKVDGKFALDEWLNLNSFIARLFGGLVRGFMGFAVWVMRYGLEEDSRHMGSESISDTRIHVACEWIKQGGQRLLRESLLNSLSIKPENANHGSSSARGSLYTGIGGFNLERWVFWKRRLTELRKGVGASIHAPIDEAITTMTVVEKLVAINASRQV